MKTKLFTLILFIAYSNSVQSVALKESEVFPCGSPDYLKCLDVSKSTCTEALTKASNQCYGSLDFGSIDYEADKEIITNTTRCFSDKFMDNLNKNDTVFKKCEHLIQNHMKTIVEKAKKEKERLDNCFFKDEDDPCHNYK